MDKVVEKIQKMGIVPVVVIENSDDAEPLAQALCDGGLPCAEITFRTNAAEKAIKTIHKNFPEMLIGAGTVLTTDQVNRAEKAGAQFIVSPGINATTVKYCIQKEMLIMPGTATPSDIELALELGLNIVKFFPSEPLGGLQMIKAIAAPYNGIKFLPTGGINSSNIREYLKYDRILACGGSWMVKSDLIREKNFNRIKELTIEAVQIVKEIRQSKYIN